MTTPDQPAADFKLVFEVGGSTTDVELVKALIQGLQAAARSHGWGTKTSHTLKYDPPGLRRLRLGNSGQASLRRAAMGALGIFTVEQLCELTAKEVNDKLSPGTLIVVRQALYYHVPQLHLKGDDPEQFPLLIDSLRVSGSTYGQLRNRGITVIAQLTDELIATFDLGSALFRHGKDFPEPESAGA